LMSDIAILPEITLHKLLLELMLIYPLMPSPQTRLLTMLNSKIPLHHIFLKVLREAPSFAIK
jgi:hypothetical protein